MGVVEMDTGINLGDEVEKYLNVRPARIAVHRNLDDFFAINRGDVIVLDGRHYVVSGTAREKGFGLDDELKPWVKYAYEIATGHKKIIKLVFTEQFDLKYGEYTVHCFRNPTKEGQALEHVRGNPYFMQGRTVTTGDGQDVRIIDYISGKTLLDEIEKFNGPHEAYYYRLLPSFLRLLLPSLKALDQLHRTAIRHGDVRSDHLILDKTTDLLRWIDFDYDFILEEKPTALDLLGIGNILSELVGQGERTLHNLIHVAELAENIEHLGSNDFSVVESTRLMNWRKLYPYVSDKLNGVLMHFSNGAELFYESVAEIVEDLEDAIISLPPGG